MTYMVLHMRRSEQGLRCRSDRAHQYGHRTPEEESFSRGSCLFARQALRSLPPASLSLCAAGTCGGHAIADSRVQGCLHRKASTEFDQSGAARSTSSAPADQRSGGSCAGGFFEAKTGKPWLNRRASANSGASGNLSGIATRRRSWRKFTRCWCPTRQRFR